MAEVAYQYHFADLGVWLIRTLSKLSGKLLDGTLAPTEILIFADRYHICELQGVAYYAQLMALLKNNADKFTVPAGCPLNQNQRARLLAGYHSLVRKWERLRDTPFVGTPPCSAHGLSCAYLMVWRNYAHSQNITQYASADVLGNIQRVHDKVQSQCDHMNRQFCGIRSDLQPSIGRACMAAMLRATQYILNHTRASLPEYLLDQIGGLDEDT